MRRALPACAIAVLLSACSPPAFTKTDLERMVLQKQDAPAGTVYIESSSGYKTLDEYARADEVKRVALQEAGFITAYFSFFLSPGFSTPGGIAKAASLADSFGLLFSTPEGASAGLLIVEQAVHRDGRDLIDRPADGIAEEAFAVKGTLQVGLPPGYLFAWRAHNAVLGLVAAGAPDNIDEEAVRVLVDRMRSRAD